MFLGQFKNLFLSFVFDFALLTFLTDVSCHRDSESLPILVELDVVHFLFRNDLIRRRGRRGRHPVVGQTSVLIGLDLDRHLHRRGVLVARVVAARSTFPARSFIGTEILKNSINWTTFFVNCSVIFIISSFWERMKLKILTE